MVEKKLNIEVGPRLTKVCCTIPKHKGIKIIDNFMFPTPADCVIDGVILDAEPLAEELKKQLSERNLSKIKKVVFSIFSSKIASREVYLPPMKDKQVGAVIATNASDYFPVDLSKYHVTYIILEHVKTREPKTRVLVLAVPMSMLEGYFTLATLCNLDITAIDSSGNSDYQALRTLNKDKVIMYVDVDCSTSYVSFIQGDSLLLQRTFAFGGDALVDNYMDSNHIAPSEFLSTLRSLSKGTDEFVGDNALSLDDIGNNLDRLINSISRSVDFFNSSRWNTSTQQIVLLGTCGKLIGLRELIEQNTGLPTMYLNEMRDISSITNSIQSPASYISCIGSNLAPVNFMPYSLKKKRVTQSTNNVQSLTFGIIAFSIFTVVGLIIALNSFINYKSALNERNAIQQEISDLEYTEPIYMSYQAHLETEQQLTDLENLYDSPNSKLSAFYQELEKKMPKEILILTASCTNEGISMDITVPGFDESAVVIKQFRSFESISNIQVSDVTLTVDESGKESANFSINCIYGINPYINDLNPYDGLFITDSDNTSETETEAAEQ